MARDHSGRDQRRLCRFIRSNEMSILVRRRRRQVSLLAWAVDVLADVFAIDDASLEGCGPSLSVHHNVGCPVDRLLLPTNGARRGFIRCVSFHGDTLGVSLVAAQGDWSCANQRLGHQSAVLETHAALRADCTLRTNRSRE